MQSRLEEYLHEVAQRLGPLPVTRRNNELKEMRQHLQNAISVNREFGQSDAEATKNAIAQFGSPEQLVSGVIQAWRRDTWLKRRDFVGATLCTFVMPFLLILLITPLISAFVPYGDRSYQIEWNLIYNLVIFGMSGLISGLVFPKRAVAGVGMAFLVLVVALALQILMIVQHAAPAMRHDLLTVNIDRFVSWDASFNIMARASAAGLAAWAASRWRRTRKSRTVASKA